MGQDARDRLIDELLAKEACRELVQLYARGLDRCDLELMRSVFWEDAVFQHANVYDGSAMGFCEMAVQFIASVGPTQHLIGQQLVQVDGDRAISESSGLSFHRAVGADGKPFDNFVAARLLDRFERRGGVWKIAHRKTVPEWNRDTDTAETWGKGLFGPPVVEEQYRGKKGKADPSYAWLTAFEGSGA